MTVSMELLPWELKVLTNMVEAEGRFREGTCESEEDVREVGRFKDLWEKLLTAFNNYKGI